MTPTEMTPSGNDRLVNVRVSNDVAVKPDSWFWWFCTVWNVTGTIKQYGLVSRSNTGKATSFYGKKPDDGKKPGEGKKGGSLALDLEGRCRRTMPQHRLRRCVLG
ncbi:hypothetical protein [Fretibacterium fastidiosum]|uniref:hypothetical protein n=1 Tax=Fretibacterium fastidiosum TaxID=651822 RepID=UPI001AD820E5|nr:hypothetical protein [Fretibacterium fastidiosum]